MFFIYFGENGQHVFYSVDDVYSIGKSMANVVKGLQWSESQTPLNKAES